MTWNTTLRKLCAISFQTHVILWLIHDSVHFANYNSMKTFKWSHLYHLRKIKMQFHYISIFMDTDFSEMVPRIVFSWHLTWTWVAYFKHFGAHLKEINTFNASLKNTLIQWICYCAHANGSVLLCLDHVDHCVLTHCGLVMSYDIIELDQHWFR